MKVKDDKFRGDYNKCKWAMETSDFRKKVKIDNEVQFGNKVSVMSYY